MPVTSLNSQPSCLPIPQAQHQTLQCTSITQPPLCQRTSMTDPQVALLDRSHTLLASRLATLVSLFSKCNHLISLNYFHVSLQLCWCSVCSVEKCLFLFEISIFTSFKECLHNNQLTGADEYRTRHTAVCALPFCIGMMVTSRL